MTTYQIPQQNVESLSAKIEKLNRRARKLNVPEITIAIGSVCGMLVEVEAHSETEWLRKGQAEGHTKTGRVMPLIEVSVDGIPPSLGNGWRFVACLEQIDTDTGRENIVRCAPGETCPSQFFWRVGECDHCKKNRFRKETFVLANVDGSFAVVGRQCLKDFLNFHPSPEQLAEFAELLFSSEQIISDESEYNPSGSKRTSWDLEKVLSITASAIRQDGWLSKTKAIGLHRHRITPGFNLANAFL